MEATDDWCDTRVLLPAPLLSALPKALLLREDEPEREGLRAFAALIFLLLFYIALEVFSPHFYCGRGPERAS